MQTARRTSVSITFDFAIARPYGDIDIIGRSSMGKLESGYLHLHKVRRLLNNIARKHADEILHRCSGIHRGMGTHISRVKSVDLDSWTDEQLQSMLRWGNARANMLVDKRRIGCSNSELTRSTDTGKQSWLRVTYQRKRMFLHTP